jgi:hypothetical protein
MADLVSTIATAVLAGLTGAGGMFALYPKMRELKDKREESEIGRLRTDVTSILAREHACEEQLTDVKARLLAVEHHHGSYLARWVKDAAKRVLWINDKAFLSIFAPLGFSRDGVLGKTFGQLLEPSAAGEIDRLDQAALAHPELPASNIIQLHPLLPVMVVVKVAAIGREGELVFEGYAYRTNDRMISDGQGASRQGAQIEASAGNLMGGV